VRNVAYRTNSLRRKPSFSGRLWSLASTLRHDCSTMPEKRPNASHHSSVSAPAHRAWNSSRPRLGRSPKTWSNRNVSVGVKKNEERKVKNEGKRTKNDNEGEKSEGAGGGSTEGGRYRVRLALDVLVGAVDLHVELDHLVTVHVAAVAKQSTQH
jgi:hypothetical protein